MDWGCPRLRTVALSAGQLRTGGSQPLGDGRGHLVPPGLPEESFPSLARRQAHRSFSGLAGIHGETFFKGGRVRQPKARHAEPSLLVRLRQANY